MDVEATTAIRQAEVGAAGLLQHFGMRRRPIKSNAISANASLFELGARSRLQNRIGEASPFQHELALGGVK